MGSFVLFGAVGLASAQNYNDQYRQWQEAQRRAQQEYADYQRSASSNNRYGYNNGYGYDRNAGSRGYRVYTVRIQG